MGKIAFEPDREMLVGEAYRVEARISVNETIENLVAGLSSGGDVKVENIPVSTFMKVRLTGPKFDISSITDERQLVTKSGYREWLWDVTPLESGIQKLTLSAFAEVSLPGQEPMTVDSRVFSSSITVRSKEEPASDQASRFFEKNWQFFIGTLLIGSGLLKWLLGKVRGKSKSAQEKPPERKREEIDQSPKK
jgi:hypothetical protein